MKTFAIASIKTKQQESKSLSIERTYPIYCVKATLQINPQRGRFY